MPFPGYAARRILTGFVSTDRIDQISRNYWNARWRLRRFFEDVRLSGDFLRDSSIAMSFPARLWFVIQCLYISLRVESPHTQGEILAFARMMLSRPPGVVVEAGCFKGGSTAKFSLIAETGRDLVVFDSFQGIPENTEAHEKDMFGNRVNFEAGSYAGSMDEVKGTIARYGQINRCRFVPGWFEETLPHFMERVAAAYVDVDLASSTATCLRYLYPILVPGGFLASQDGHLPLVVDMLREWQSTNGVECHDLGKAKFVWISKSAGVPTKDREQ